MYNKPKLKVRIPFQMRTLTLEQENRRFYT